MFSTKNGILSNRFKSLRDNLSSIDKLEDFYNWRTKVVKLAIDSGLELEPLLEEMQRGKFDPSADQKNQYPEVDESYILKLYKSAAEKNINKIILLISRKIEEGKAVTNPFWDKFDVKWLFTTVVALIAIIVTLLAVGLPNQYKLGYDTAKSNTEALRQREIDLLNDKIDKLNQKIMELRRDSISFR